MSLSSRQARTHSLSCLFGGTLADMGRRQPLRFASPLSYVDDLLGIFSQNTG